jgi:hypothetical protein
MTMNLFGFTVTFSVTKNNGLLEGKALYKKLIKVIKKETFWLGIFSSRTFQEVFQNTMSLKIALIRQVRELGGLGLKEAKDFVELWFNYDCSSALKYLPKEYKELSKDFQKEGE